MLHHETKPSPPRRLLLYRAHHRGIEPRKTDFQHVTGSYDHFANDLTAAAKSHATPDLLHFGTCRGEKRGSRAISRRASSRRPALYPIWVRVANGEMAWCGRSCIIPRPGESIGINQPSTRFGF